MTRLEEVLKRKKDIFDDYGVAVTYDESGLPSVCSANLDSSNYVGTITHWPETRFEFQFNSSQSGEVILLETEDFSDDIELASYIEEIYSEKLKQ